MAQFDECVGPFIFDLLPQVLDEVLCIVDSGLFELHVATEQEALSFVAKARDDALEIDRRARTPGIGSKIGAGSNQLAVKGSGSQRGVVCKGVSDISDNCVSCLSNSLSRQSKKSLRWT